MEHLSLPLSQSGCWYATPPIIVPTIWITDNAAYIDLGRVLAGIQAPEEDSAQFSVFLSELGYPYVEETHNEVYKRYLRK
jgi:hypothetical protein